MTNNIVQQDIASLLDGWIEAERNGVQFPVPFDLAWGIAGYSRKDHAKRRLLNKKSRLVENRDYLPTSGEWLIDGRSSDSIQLTCDAFKQFCLLAETEEGDNIRQYFIESEKKWRLVQQVAPRVADEVEILHLKLEIAKQEAIAEVARKESQSLRHYVVTSMPAPIADRILGVTAVKEVEYVDRTILPNGHINDGVGITYLQKRYGFKTTKETWAYLDSVGCGKDSELWTHQLKAVESSVLDRSHLAMLDRLLQSATRQQWIGERSMFE
jgi:phage anti-repressor protein